MKKNIKRCLSLLLAVVTVFSVFSFCAFGAEKKACGGRYGEVITVKSNYKTPCSAYTFNTDSGKIFLYFDAANGYSDSARKCIFYGFELYYDESYSNKMVALSGQFPKSDSTATVPLNAASIPSGTYYGMVYTWVSNKNGVFVDSDSIAFFTVKINKIANVTPALSSPSVTAKGNYFKWSSVKYAESYRVYRKAEGETSWGLLQETAKTSFTDTTAEHGVKYYYTVRAVENGAYSKYNKTGVSLIYLEAPKVNKPTAGDNNTLTVTWSKVTGAAGYMVYRKGANDSAYTRVAKLAGDVTKYTDKANKTDGAVYYYKVRAYNGTSNGLLSSAVKVVTFLAPEINAFYSDYETAISWKDYGENAVYTLYKRTDGTEWSVFYEGTDTECYDKAVSEGEAAYYSLKVNLNGQESSFNTVGEKVVPLGDTVITSVANGADNSVVVKWNNVNGATYYEILRKNAGGKYEYIGKTTKLSFTDKTEKKNNLKYSYTVVACNENAAGSQGYEYLNHLYMAMPNISGVTTTKNGNKVTWERLSGATSYKVYRKTADGSWKALATLSNTKLSYTDTTAKAGTTYYYTVAAMNGSVKGCYNAGVKIEN